MNRTKEHSKKIDRKKFFSSAGTGVFAFVLFQSFPFNLFAKKTDERVSNKIEVKLNPNAVSRNNTERKNG